MSMGIPIAKWRVASASTLFHWLSIDHRAEDVTISSGAAGIAAWVVPLATAALENDVGKRRCACGDQQASEDGKRDC